MHPSSLIRIGDHMGLVHELRSLAFSDPDLYEQKVGPITDLICQKLFNGYTTDDVHDDEMLKADIDWWHNASDEEAETYARSRGYTFDGEYNVPDIWSFVWMMLAEQRGLLPADAAGRAERRLKKEAVKFSARSRDRR